MAVVLLPFGDASAHVVVLLMLTSMLCCDMMLAGVDEKQRLTVRKRMMHLILCKQHID